MAHKDVLYEISIYDGPVQSVAKKELKKARHSTKTLIGLYTIVLNSDCINTYSSAAVSFMKAFIEAEMLQAENVKSDVLNIRISPKERRMLEEKAKNKQRSVSQYIRDILFADTENHQ